MEAYLPNSTLHLTVALWMRIRQDIFINMDAFYDFIVANYDGDSKETK